MAAVHRVAVFTLHHPTRHVQAALERAFRDYSDAYAALLRAGARFTVDELREMATYALDPASPSPRMSARALARRLFACDDLSPSVASALELLPSRLRQSAKEHAGQTLLSHVVRAAAEDASSGADADASWPQGDRAAGAPLAHDGGSPRAPTRRRRVDVEPVRRRALEDLARLADSLGSERQLLADLLRGGGGDRDPVAIPFVGVHAHHGCGLYYQRENRRFYARLDIVHPKSRAARPIAVRGRYLDLKSGVTYAASSDTPAADGSASFGRGRISLLVPLELMRYHEETLRYTRAAFLPQRGTDPRHPEPAVPVTARLVRRIIRGAVRHQLHVTFRLPEPPSRAQDGGEQRPILAIHRGLVHLYSAVVTTPDATRELAPGFAASGEALMRVQAALERARRGAQPTVRDRRQRRIAGHHVAVAANQVVEQAQRHGAQVVCEDLGAFASGRAVRAIRHPVPARQRAARALLSRRQFEALRRAIDARLEVAGLARMRVVPAAGIAQTCTRCGHRDAASRDPEDRRLFRCVVCGATGDVDTVAATNIARKFAWLLVRQEQTAAGVQEGERVRWEAFLGALCQQVAESHDAGGDAQGE
jgi:hypothetical protein